MSATPRLLCSVLFAAGLVTTAVHAADAAPAAAPSETSIKELMKLTESRKLIDGLPSQVEAAMQSALQEALGGDSLTPEQEKVLKELGAKTTTLFRKEMSWEVLEPMFLTVYSKTFTQPEIDGMIAFYKTEPGQAVIAKMPAVMQSTMDLVQERMQTLQPQLIQYQHEAVQQLQAIEQAAPAQPPADKPTDKPADKKDEAPAK